MTHVLVVCTGNLCRSPVAETLLRERLGHAASFASAGTHPWNGRSAPRPMRRALRGLGVVLPPRRPAQVTGEHLVGADLVIALGEEHRTYLLLLRPPDPSRIVTLGELERAAEAGVPLAGVTVAERIAAMPRAASAHPEDARPSRAPVFRDPYGGTEADYREALERLSAAVSRVSAWALAGDGATPRWAAVRATDAPAPERS